jgi:hypothetical protein
MNMTETKMAVSISDIFRTMIVLKCEDSKLYEKIYEEIEEVIGPRHIVEQIMVSDFVSHLWEKLRLRRCVPAVVAAATRMALERLLRPTAGQHAEVLADCYFLGKPGPSAKENLCCGDTNLMTREDVIAILEAHGLNESAIEPLAIAAALDTLTAIEHLAQKHEDRCQALMRNLERRQKKQEAAKLRAAGDAKPSTQVDDITKQRTSIPRLKRTDLPPPKTGSAA